MCLFVFLLHVLLRNKKKMRFADIKKNKQCVFSKQGIYTSPKILCDITLYCRIIFYRSMKHQDDTARAILRVEGNTIVRR